MYNYLLVCGVLGLNVLTVNITRTLGEHAQFSGTTTFGVLIEVELIIQTKVL
jgi:hypothetical protein